ncbi:MAG: tRNA uridine-5-carboxymethylaminomethyl(34) synthesis GTPase MnmE, partial [Saezia sp.]
SLQARYATLLPFKDKAGKAIDQGLAIYFPAPHSYTGEDVLELQAHGGPVVLQLILKRCLELANTKNTQGQALLPSLRLARPGEFTERAFLNDKIDLVQAEGIADLINATTEMAARSAGRSLDGLFSAQIQALLDALIALRMLVEATLDFPEEEIDFLERDDAYGQAAQILSGIEKLLETSRQGALLRNGLSIVIAGQPNAGKSSLLNALAGSDVAIVTPIAGTTRDKVTQTIQIEGIPLHIIDTAGLRESSDEVEKIGIDRAWKEIGQADAVIFLHDLERQKDAEYQEQEQKLHQQIMQLVSREVTVLEVYNKSDIKALTENQQQQSNASELWISAKTGYGIQELREKLLEIAGWQAMPEDVFMARERHIQSLQKTYEHVAAAFEFLDSDYRQLELIAEELRLAQRSLGEITGVMTADDLLGVIFSQFCIGK